MTANKVARLQSVDRRTLGLKKTAVATQRPGVFRSEATQLTSC